MIWMGALTIGAILLAQGSLSAGSLISGYLLLPTLTRFYKIVSQQILERKAEAEKLQRLDIFYGDDEVHQAITAEATASASPRTANKICLNDITFTYPGQTAPILEHYSRTFSADTCEILSGENGCGKTTILSLICGLFEPENGSITDEQGIPLSPQARASLVTMQEQDGKIFSGTILENLWIPQEDAARGAQLLSQTGLEKPLDEMLSSNGDNLSPGERKKIILARALLRNPPILALDEPFNHLDSRGRTFLQHYLDQRGGGIIFVNHQQTEPSPNPSPAILEEAIR